MSVLADGINRQAPPDQVNREMELTKQERELIVKLRLLDCFRYNHGRNILVVWNGARLIVFDTTQI
jgi:hypothetical protein